MAKDQVFLRHRAKKHNVFSWDGLGDIKEGRGSLGEEMPVLVYRLMQYTMMDVMSREMGEEKANEFFRAAGFLAGTEFARNALDLKQDFSEFAASLQKALADLKVGILRIESFDPDTGNMVICVNERIDCGGIPASDKNFIVYDEGFISGVLDGISRVLKAWPDKRCAILRRV